MANGYALGVLQHQKEVSRGATPQYKIEPYGFLASLLAAHTRHSVKNDKFDGHTQTAKIKAKQRMTVAQTQTEKSCSNVATQPYAEQTVSLTNVRQIAIHVEDEVIAQMDSTASNRQSAGSLSVMAEHMDSVATAAGALLSACNQDLLTLALANIGVNRATGNTTSQAVNFPLSTTSNNLALGATKLMSDFALNNMKGQLITVGAGLFHNYMMQQPAKSADATGLNSRMQAGNFDFYVDYDLQTIATGTGAANRIFVYEKDAVQLVEYLEYQGFKAGVKPGASEFGTISLPMMSAGGMLVPVEFDFQLRYNDCEQVFDYADGETSVTLQKGYNLILSKRFGLYTIPSTAYRSGDVLAGNRGSLSFYLTNS